MRISADNMLSALRSRREFLKLLAKGLGYTTLVASMPGCGGGGGGDSDTQQPRADIPRASPAYRVLKRTSFGVRRDELDAIENLGIDSYLERQLNYQLIDDGNLESGIRALFPQIHQTAAQIYAGFSGNIETVVRQMIAATQYRQMFSRRQLYEVMVEFWTDHFNIHLLNGLCPALKPVDDLQVIRRHALGNFHDLLHASAKSPAMLFYLDNFSNLATAPNENYARELMELHTLGVDGGYTEEDVKEVARCFTGWSVQIPGISTGEFGLFLYVDDNHDQGGKSVLGHPIAAGGGEQDGMAVLELLANHPSTARFLASKLVRRFISDTPDTATVDAVADAFLASDGDIRATLRTLFSSDAFRNSADQKITRPSEYLAGMIRALAPTTDFPTDDGRLFFYAQSILGQLPYNWHTPDGYPDLQSHWLSTGGMLNRWRLSFISFANLLSEISVIRIDYASMVDGANTLASLVDTLVDCILMRPLSLVDRESVLDWLVSEYGLSADADLPAGRAQQIAPYVAAVMISSAYFHLR